jgi:hypothetical protein
LALAAEPQPHPTLGYGLEKEGEEERLRQKGFSNMLSHDEIAGTIESQGAIFSEDAVSEAFQIEEVLNRAHEIHRARGGLLGYDLEDWLEAERDLAARNRAGQFQGEETARAESVSLGQERNCEKCFRLNN